ncbi:DUF4136 domain-containing protein [Roseateles violae]|uniref:DUF4136 domain-containing protein n=1 Tax=Roseateles violae TaxID=3058042 RepID=A0ABT8DW28_9BURK|nr:DUF4136 domain-containing protein [Pelomonas sp. PFR6]MDN3922467.1 DUF4136 domain-containing protein [Pelomonas sp. PFR6]
MNRRPLLLAGLAVLVAGLVACAGPYTISADVVSFGAWPEARGAGSYAFERLPSQQLSRRQAELEYHARPALERAGFRPAADPKTADVLISLGAQVNAQDYPYWGDPIWWGWRGPGWGYWGYGGYYWRYGGWPYGPYGSYWGPGWYWPERRYEREVAVLVRDRASNEALFEAHASSEGYSVGDAALISAMFSAALSDFPRPNPESHRISVMVTPAAPAPQGVASAPAGS